MSVNNKPEPLTLNLSRCALTIKNNCGECLHFKKMAYPAFRKPCIDMGIIKEAKPCAHFQVNPENIRFTESRHAKNIAKAIEEFSPRELKNLAALINQEERTRRYKFKLGQPVYFRVFGGDYISNYVKAYVVSADTTYVYVEGVDGYTAALYHKSVLRPSKWYKKELELLKANKQLDPNFDKYTKTPTKHENKIRSIISKTIATLSSDMNISTGVSSGAKLRKKTGYTPLDELCVNTRG